MVKSLQTYSVSDCWPQVQAISFDLDNTLWPIEPVIEKAERQLWSWLEYHHPRITEKHDLLSLRRHRADTAVAFPELSHDISALRRQSLECLLNEFGYAGDLTQAKAQATAGWQVFYRARHQIEWYQDALPSLERLQTRFRLAATTNGNANLELLGIADNFSAVLRAGEVGCSKPGSAIWAALCDALALPPEQILHIGDNPNDDVLGAANYGLPAVWLNRNSSPWPGDHRPPFEIISLDQLLP